MNISKSKGSRNAGFGAFCAFQLGSVCGVLIPFFHHSNQENLKSVGPSLPFSDVIHRIKQLTNCHLTYIILFGFVLAVLPSHFFPSHLLLSFLFILGLNSIFILIFHFQICSRLVSILSDILLSVMNFALKIILLIFL